MNRILSICVAAALGAAHGTPAAGTLDLDAITFQEVVSSGVGGALAVRNAGDGSNRLFVVRQGGTIRVVNASGTLLATPFLNIGSGGTAPPLGFTSGGERGLLGLAFHPQYASNGRFFINYTDSSGNTAVTEYTVSTGNPDVADATSGRVILRVYQPASNHNGGDIHFGADGYLYIGMGDGGGGNDPCEAGQALTPGAVSGCTPGSGFTGTPPSGVPRGNAESRALLGKMLRIDVDSTNTPANADLCGADTNLRTYGIPPGNPFAGDAGSNAAACDEIYHYGLRNPWRFSFDRANHDLIIGDVGQNAWEEMDLVPGSAAGLNFGWKVCEGFHVRGSGSNLCTLVGRTDPILEYDHNVGVSITGGYRYRGPYTSITGVLFYADAYYDKLFAATESGGSWTLAKTWSNNPAIATLTGFGEGEDGHLYFTAMNAGKIYRIVAPMLPADGIFENGFEGP